MSMRWRITFLSYQLSRLRLETSIHMMASVFLVKEFKQGAEVSSRKRTHEEIQGTDDLGTDSKQPKRKNIKQRAIFHEDEMARLTPYPIKSMLKMGRRGIRLVVL